MVQSGVALWVHCSLAKITTHVKRLVHNRTLCILKAIVIGDRFRPAEGARNITAVELRYRLVAVS